MEVHMKFLAQGVTGMKTGVLALAIGVAFASIGFASAAERSARAAGDVQVLSGGVGEDARKELAEQARDHNLKLVFTLSTGHFVAEVPFQVNRGGKVIVDEVASGPWAFVKLPPGSYAVKANYEGRTQTKQVSVPARGQKRVVFTWPAPARVKQQPD
jgi:hypothetical protein